MLVYWGGFGDIGHLIRLDPCKDFDKYNYIHNYIYNYILTPPVMCSQQLSVLHWKSNLLLWKINLKSSTMSLVF